MAEVESKVSSDKVAVDSDTTPTTKKLGQFEAIRQRMGNSEALMRHYRIQETSKSKGRPLQVVSAKQPYQFELDTEALKQIFQDPRVADSKVAILSIAGSCRQGKSFLMNFFLKYLQAEGVLLWLNDEENVLENGFSWAPGVEPHTSGIVMWSEPFLIRDANGDMVVLLLMDTQGAFNCESTLKECVHIFSLSVLISSIQIFNVMSNIREIDLQHLHFFTEYSKLALAEGVSQPFQHLMFLIRDWSYPYQYPYGAEGGQALIDKRLEVSDSQHSEIRELREDLQKCFSRISCFLLPHPGFKASNRQDYKGQIKDLDEDFKTNMFHLVPSLIGKENLVVKEFNKSPLTGKEIMEYFLIYFNIFQANDLPDPKSVLQMTSEANNMAAIIVAQDHYTKAMKRMFGGNRSYTDFKIILDQHKITKQESLKIFELTPKMGSEELSAIYMTNLEKHLDEWFNEFAKTNETKVTGQMGMTPGILFVTIVVLYMFSGVLNMLWLGFLSFIPDTVSYCMIGLLATWLLVKYTGEHNDVSDVVDNIALGIWDLLFLPIWIRIDHNAEKWNAAASVPRMRARAYSRASVS